MSADKRLFLDLVARTMAAHPEWTPDVFEAVVDGSRAAIGELIRRCGAAHGALQAALILRDGKRLTPDFVAHLNGMILRAVPPDGVRHLAPAELEAYRAAIRQVVEARSRPTNTGETP